ncbi:MAG: M48 family metalloprotease [Gemmatimonadota bacterium]
MSAPRLCPSIAVAIVAASLLAPAPSGAQILDRILDKAEQAKEVADKVGAAVVPISTEQEIEIGRGIAATIAGHYGVLSDSLLTRYVNLVGTAVAAVDPRPDVRYRFAVLDTDDVNAFAAPGGYVFVTRGALAIMADEAVLAGVLAHEVAHVNHRDVVEEIQSRARTEIGIDEAAERIDITGEEYLQKAVETGASALFMGLSREDELAADAFGVRAAAAAGYDPSGLQRFVTAISAAPSEKRSLLTKTHPDAEDRIAAIESEIGKLSAGERQGVTAAERFQERVAATTGGGAVGR